MTAADPAGAPVDGPGVEARWVDAHCHPASVTAGADAVLDAAREAGVAWVVAVGTDLASSREAVALAARRDDVVATVGLHPHDADRLDAEWAELEALVRGGGVAAVGEAGFDLHYNNSPVAAQAEAFRRQVRLANEVGLPLVVHTREAWDETFEVLASEGVPERLVFHCFTGGPDEARRALAVGGHLSFSGIVSFKNAADVRAAAALTPADRLLVETDAPYLAPVPHRGRENSPALLPAVGAALATAVGRSVDEVAETTATVAREVFRS